MLVLLVHLPVLMTSIQDFAACSKLLYEEVVPLVILEMIVSLLHLHVKFNRILGHTRRREK